MGVSGGFPLIALGGLSDFRFNWWVQNVKTPTEAFSGGLAQVLPNLVLALIVVILFLFFSNLQNDTMEKHEDEIRAWFGPILRPLEALFAAGAVLQSNMARGGLGWVVEGIKLIGILFIYGLIFSFLDPSFTFANPGWLLMVVAVMLSVGLVSIIDDIAVVLYSRSQGGGGSIGINGGNFGVALGSMIFSRFAGLAPGVVFGSAASAKGELKGDEDRQNLLGLLATGIAALIAWLASAFIPQTPGADLWLSTLVILVFAVGLQTLFFELVPLTGTMGNELFNRHRILWFAVFVGVTFLFLQTQLNPNGLIAGMLQQSNMVTFVLIVGIFCLISGGLWLYFALRDRQRRV